MRWSYSRDNIQPEYIPTELMDEPSRRCEWMGTYTTGNWAVGEDGGAKWSTMSRGTIAWTGSFSILVTFGSWRNIDGNEYLYNPLVKVPVNKLVTMRCKMRFGTYYGYIRLTGADSGGNVSYASNFYYETNKDFTGTQWYNFSVTFPSGSYTDWYFYIHWPYGKPTNYLFLDEMSVTY